MAVGFGAVHPDPTSKGGLIYTANLLASGRLLRTTSLPAWQKPFAELYHHLSGLSAPVARRRLRDDFFVDQEDAPGPTRMGAFLELLRDESRGARVDRKEETVDEMILDLAPDITIIRSLITAGRSPTEAAQVKIYSKTSASAR